MQTLTLRASAKLNLTLSVGSVRPDGYHEIRSVMQKISLFDTLEFAKADRTSLSSDLVYLPCDERNLCVRAVEEYRKLTGISGGLDIRLIKKIPVGAGLGGGSADAAATIRALEELYTPLSQEARLSLAALLGADVPFCLKSCTTALCEGIGERITPIDNRLPEDACRVLLYKEGRKASTARVYAAFDELSASKNADKTDAMIASLESGDTGAFYKALFNDLTDAIESSGQPVKAQIARMLEYGADAALMSGAGPTVYGLFRDPKKLDDAYAGLKAPDALCLRAHFLN